MICEATAWHCPSGVRVREGDMEANNRSYFVSTSRHRFAVTERMGSRTPSTVGPLGCSSSDCDA